MADSTADSSHRIVEMPWKTGTSIVCHTMAWAFLFGNFIGAFQLFGSWGSVGWLSPLCVFIAFVIYTVRLVLFMAPINFDGKTRKLAWILDIVCAGLITAAILVQIILSIVYPGGWYLYFGCASVFFALVALIIAIVVDYLDMKS